MRTIKFRGRDSNGYTIYGGISRNGKAIVLDDAGSRALVDPDSVAQLVGYDTNGKEIYEGDTLIDEKGFIYKAFLQPSVEWEKEKERKDFFGWSGMPLAFTKQFTKLNLKEASERAAD